MDRVRVQFLRGAFGAIVVAVWLSAVGVVPRAVGAGESSGLVDEVTSRVLSNKPVDPTSLTLALEQMPEDLLYEMGEYFRLTKQLDKERQALGELVERFPKSDYVPKARFELAYIHLLTRGMWPQSAAMFEQVAQLYPGTGFDEAARQYRHAITEPSTLEDLDILLGVFRTAKFDLHGMVAGDFAALFVADMAEKEKVVEQILKADLPPSEKACLLSDTAYASLCCGRTATAKSVYEAILANDAFSTDSELLAGVHFMLGYIEAFRRHDYKEGLAHFQKAASWGDTAAADDSLWQIGIIHEMNGQVADALGAYRDLLDRYPNSAFAPKAKGRIEALGRVVASAENPRERRLAVAAVVEAVWWRVGRLFEEAVAWLPGEVPPAPGQQAGRPCGPRAVREVCALCGIELSREESMALCRPDASGETSFLDVARAIRSQGLVVEAREIGLEQLRALAREGSPVIVHLRNHFAVLKSLEGGRARLVDDRGEYFLPLSYFTRRWDGYVLVVRRPASGKVASGKAV